MKKITNILKKIKEQNWKKIFNQQKEAFKQGLKELLPCCLK